MTGDSRRRRRSAAIEGCWRFRPRVTGHAYRVEIVVPALVGDLHPLRTERSRPRLNAGPSVCVFRRGLVRARLLVVAGRRDEIRHVWVGLNVEASDARPGHRYQPGLGNVGRFRRTWRRARQLGRGVIPRIARDVHGAKIVVAALIGDLHPLRAERSPARCNPHAPVLILRRRFVRARPLAVASLPDDVRHVAFDLDVEAADPGLRDRNLGVCHAKDPDAPPACGVAINPDGGRECKRHNGENGCDFGMSHLFPHGKRRRAKHECQFGFPSLRVARWGRCSKRASLGALSVGPSDDKGNLAHSRRKQ